MSILGWFLKPKKDMAKSNTKPVRIGKYNVTSHAQNRIVDKARKLRKVDMVDNLICKPLAITAIKTDKQGRPSYSRVGKTAVTAVNPQNNNVCSIKRVNDRDAKRFDLEKRGRKYANKKDNKKDGSINNKGSR